MKHRRIYATALTDGYDLTSWATCSKAPERRVCGETFCPRHEPEAYASHMARHATDTLASA